MKKITKIIAVILLFSLLTVNCAYTAKDEKTIYLIIWNDFCIIVRTPSRQLTTMIGQEPLGIILKDNKTRITISNAYLTISISPEKLKRIISQLTAKKKIFLE